MSEPKVFDQSVLTLALTRESISAVCGVADIGFIKSLSVHYDGEAKSVKSSVEFYRSHHPETSRQIEEAVRNARALGWLEVSY